MIVLCLNTVLNSNHAESESEYDLHSSCETNSSSTESIDGPGVLVFRPPSGHDAELDPVVELWYELTEHMKDEDIHHPSELYAERDRLIRYDRSSCSIAVCLRGGHLPVLYWRRVSAIPSSPN